MQRDVARRVRNTSAAGQQKFSRKRRLSLEPLEVRNLLAGVNQGAADPEFSRPANLAAALVDDAYEQNDTITTAKNLGTLTASLTINNLVQADAHDWYRFSLPKTAASSASISLEFLHSQGDLDLELYSSYGYRLQISQGITNSEAISLAGRAAGTYYVHVYGYRGATNPNYSLSINSGTVATPTDDSYENNDTQGLASNLGTLTTNASVANLALLDSADWFRFTTTATGTTTSLVSISFQNTQGNLALQLVNAAGSVISTSNGSGNAESVSLANLASGTYYARVYSATGATNPSYSLQIVAPTAPPPPTSSGAFDIQISYTGFTASQRTIFEQAAARWEAIIVSDLPNASYNGVSVDDLLINATSTAIDGVGSVLGQAGYDRIRTTGTRLPYHGSMEFDSADLASMEANGSLLAVITHEIGHVLGIGTLWQSKGLLVGAGTSNPLFTGPQAVAAYNAIFGTNVTGVPVENSGGSGTRDAHWRESTFNNEIMTGYINSGSNPLSRVTVASLADLGYSVNIAAADAYTRPGGSAVVAPVSSPTSRSGTRSPYGAISEPISRSPVQARNLDPSLVFAVIDQLARAARSGTPATVFQAGSAGLNAGTSAGTWSEAVDLLFAGETDLCRDGAG
jgi:hypothetical protein